MTEKPFWETKRLAEMTAAEWESVCDGCGRCCLHKLRDEETAEIAWTDVACRLLDGQSCRCRDYPRRQLKVPDCVQLTPDALAEIDWLPPSCAYRRLQEGKGLAWWHWLVSGDRNTVHEAGVSVRGRSIDERQAGPLEDHVVTWPGRRPRAPRAARAGHARQEAMSPEPPVVLAEASAAAPGLSAAMAAAPPAGAGVSPAELENQPAAAPGLAQTD